MSARQKKINLNTGEIFEKDVLSNISKECTVAARVNETSGGFSTPDLVCLQEKENGETKTRLIEAKFNGYIQPKQRQELEEIAKNSHENVEIQIAHPSKEGNIEINTEKEVGESGEDLADNLKLKYDQEKAENKKKYRDKKMTEEIV